MIATQQPSDNESSEHEVAESARKGEITGVRLAILLKAQNIIEDSCIFKDPFPNPQQNLLGRVDAWKSASRNCDIKGEIPDLEDGTDKYVSNPLQLCTCSDII